MTGLKSTTLQIMPKNKRAGEARLASLLPSASASVWVPVCLKLFTGTDCCPWHRACVFFCTRLILHPLAHPSWPLQAWIHACPTEWVSPRNEGVHLPVYSVFISLESVVNGGAHTRRHGVGVGGVRVLVSVHLGTVVEVNRLHGPGAVRVSVHGGRDAHTVHPVVGQVFVLHTTNTRVNSEYRRTRLY